MVTLEEKNSKNEENEEVEELIENESYHSSLNSINETSIDIDEIIDEENSLFFNIDYELDNELNNEIEALKSLNVFYACETCGEQVENRNQLICLNEECGGNIVANLMDVELEEINETNSDDVFIIDLGTDQVKYGWSSSKDPW